MRGFSGACTSVSYLLAKNACEDCHECERAPPISLVMAHATVSAIKGCSKIARVWDRCILRLTYLTLPCLFRFCASCGVIMYTVCGVSQGRWSMFPSWPYSFCWCWWWKLVSMWSLLLTILCWRLWWYFQATSNIALLIDVSVDTTWKILL